MSLGRFALHSMRPIAIHVAWSVCVYFEHYSQGGSLDAAYGYQYCDNLLLFIVSVICQHLFRYFMTHDTFYAVSMFMSFLFLNVFIFMSFGYSRSPL